MHSESARTDEPFPKQINGHFVGVVLILGRVGGHDDFPQE
jgi:hypothetical protein